jgi:hypothetical protein
VIVHHCFGAPFALSRPRPGSVVGMTDVLDEPATADLTSRRRRRRWPWVAGAAAVPAIAGIAFVLFWFQPQKLFIDDRVDEPIPTVSVAPARDAEPRLADSAATTATVATSPSAAAATTAPVTTAVTPAPAPAPAEPAELARGAFVSRDHGTSGIARVLDLGDGRRIVRLEALDTDNGPDLYVYLTSNPATGDEGAFDDDYVDLGRLKGNLGDQNYDLPAGTDLGRFATVVIWCDRFDSAFGAADLTIA